MLSNENIMFPQVDPENTPNPPEFPNMYHAHPHPIPNACAPHVPPKPSFTVQEEFIETTRRVNETLNRVLNMESHIRKTLDEYMKTITADNVAFKNLCTTTYNQFAQTVHNEVNAFESELTNAYTAFSETVKKDADGIKASFELFKSDVNNMLSVFNDATNKAIEDYKNEMQGNFDSFVDDIQARFTQHENDTDEKINTFKSDVNSSIANHENKIAKDFNDYKAELNTTYDLFRDAIESRLEQYNSTYEKAFHDYTTSTNRKLAEMENHFNENYETFVEQTNASIYAFENEWTGAISARLDGQDSVINDAVLYMKSNLHSTASEIITALYDNVGLLDSSVMATPEMYEREQASDSQCIADAIDSGRNYILFTKSVYDLGSPIAINRSNVTLNLNGATLNADTMGGIYIMPGCENIKILNGTITAKNGTLQKTQEMTFNETAGIIIGTNTKNILIENCVIKDIENHKETYGIFVPCFGCENITIKNCVIDGVQSYDDGSIANSQGWSKGVCVGYTPYYSEDYPGVVDENTYSKNIKIIGNTIKNVKSAEDGDGIYIEGLYDPAQNSTLYDMDVLIEGNYFENCGKRFIKVVPCGGVTIRNNKGVITPNSWQTERMHSFISVYAPNGIIEGNEFICRKNHVLYCIDVGVQAEHGDYKKGTMIIRNNKIYNSFYREGDNTACIYYAPYTGFYKSLIIDGNELIANYYGILINQETAECIYGIQITNNKIHDNTDLCYSGCDPIFRSMQFEKGMGTINIENNNAEGSNACISFSDTISGTPTIVIIRNNNLNSGAKMDVFCQNAIIQNNFVVNASTTRRFEVHAHGFVVSENNHDTAGGSTAW